jgi:hypothetical protein
MPFPPPAPAPPCSNAAVEAEIAARSDAVARACAFRVAAFEPIACFLRASQWAAEVEAAAVHRPANHVERDNGSGNHNGNGNGNRGVDLRVGHAAEEAAYRRAFFDLRDRDAVRNGGRDAERNPRVPNLSIVSSFSSGASGKWTCAQCTLHNPATSTECDACAAPKPPPYPPASDALQSSASAAAASSSAASLLFQRNSLFAGAAYEPPPAAAAVWACPVCTMENPRSASSCEACLNPRP